MKKFMMFALIAVFSVAVLCAGGVKKAEALMFVSVSDGSGTSVYEDNVATGVDTGTIFASEGDIGLSGAAFGWMTTSTIFTGPLFSPSEITTTVDFSKPIAGTSLKPSMDLSGTVKGAGTYTLKLTDTDFGPYSSNPFPAFSFQNGGSHADGGTFSITVDYYADLGNVKFGEGIHLGTVGPLSSDPFAGSAVSGLFTGDDSYSLTIKVVIAQTGGITTFDTDMGVVPEPGTIALLGIGLAGLVGVGVRRRAKKNAA